MNLKVRDDRITLGSVFQLAALGWASFGVSFLGLCLLLMFGGVASGSMMINNELVEGHAQVFMAMLPFIVILALVLGMQALMFAGFITLGAALYRLIRPLTVTFETTIRS
jgi:hypothetical protein